MNEKKIKKLEAQIEELKKERPRTDREILESIERTLKRIEIRQQNQENPFYSTVLNRPLTGTSFPDNYSEACKIIKDGVELSLSQFPINENSVIIDRIRKKMMGPIGEQDYLFYNK